MGAPVPADDLPSGMVPASDLPGAPTAPKAASVTPTKEAPTILENVKSSPWRLLAPQGLLAEEAGRVTDKAAYQGGGIATDVLSSAGLPPEIAAAGGYLTNVGVQGAATLAGGVGGRATLADKSQDLGRRWMQQALQPSKHARETGKADQAVETLLQEGVSVSKGGVAKLDKTIDDLQDTMTAALKNNPYVIEPRNVIKELDSVFTKYREQATPNADLATIQKALNEFINHPLINQYGGIPIEMANRIKSGTYRAVGPKAYGQAMPSDAERDAQKGLARGLQREITATPGIPEGVGAKQRDLINARDLAEERVSAHGNKMDAGLAWMVQHPIAALGFLADRSPYFKSLAARAAYSGTIPAVAGEVAGGAAGAASGLPPREQRR